MENEAQKIQSLHSKTSPAGQIDKGRSLPAYAQLADILKNQIANGAFTPESRMPSESALAKQHGVSLMTVRQAVGVLVDQGLVKRVHGSGTFVQKVEVSATHFKLDALKSVLSDHDQLKVKILKSTVARAQGAETEILRLTSGDPVILMERLILHGNAPFTLQTAYILYDPEAPMVEGMLDTTVLSGLLFSRQPSGFKKANSGFSP